MFSALKLSEERKLTPLVTMAPGACVGAEFEWLAFERNSLGSRVNTTFTRFYHLYPNVLPT
jgi:hypothetical protein